VASRESSKAAGSERTCIVTRVKGPPQEMIRFVLGPGQVVVPDLRGKLPGRGVWVTARADLVAKAAKRCAFSRSFKTNAVASDRLADEIDYLMTKDCLQALSLANKAGQVISGFAKVEVAIADASLAGLIQAVDCGAEGWRKLGECLRRRGHNKTVPRIALFRSSQLDLALGRTNVVHAALVGGAASQGFLERCRRLMLFRSSSPQAEGSDRLPRPGTSGELNGVAAFWHAETEVRERKTDERHQESR
jgi:uncharacterized protein